MDLRWVLKKSYRLFCGPKDGGETKQQNIWWRMWILMPTCTVGCPLFEVLGSSHPKVENSLLQKPLPLSWGNSGRFQAVMWAPLYHIYHGPKSRPSLVARREMRCLGGTRVKCHVPRFWTVLSCHRKHKCWSRILQDPFSQNYGLRWSQVIAKAIYQSLLPSPTSTKTHLNLLMAAIFPTFTGVHMSQNSYCLG